MSLLLFSIVKEMSMCNTIIEMSTNKMCIICANEKNDFIEADNVQQYENSLFECFNFPFKFDYELLPKRICVECSNKINGAFELKSMIIEAQNKLKLICERLCQVPELTLQSEDSSDSIQDQPAEPDSPFEEKPKRKLSKQFNCDLCSKKFTTKQSLNWHLKIHKGIKEYTCDQCGKSFAQKGNLESHIFAHLNVTPFCCDQCPKRFKTKLRLKRHSIMHIDTKPFECHCGRTFREKWALNRHAKVHSSELPFECEYCQKCFRLKAFLKTHLRQHTGERPYSCVECNHDFTNSSNYIKHMRSRHGKPKKKSIDNST